MNIGFMPGVWNVHDRPHIVLHGEPAAHPQEGEDPAPGIPECRSRDSRRWEGAALADPGLRWRGLPTSRTATGRRCSPIAAGRPGPDGPVAVDTGTFAIT
ncbi:hypothetical protein GCM10010191_71160 [Actinomadura vinacea]|uniref:Uncharacterized protein n=1 Tax=Actinomadura vinacea TaxID=115336 RepID=A0ABP5X3M5_9ACTN